MIEWSFDTVKNNHTSNNPHQQNGCRDNHKEEYVRHNLLIIQTSRQVIQIPNDLNIPSQVEDVGKADNIIELTKMVMGWKIKRGFS